MILSIDIGLKNLAFCVMKCGEDTQDMSCYSIHLWDTYNTLQEEEHKCKGLLKNDRGVCNKKTSLQYIDADGARHYTCKTHFPKDPSLCKKNYKEKAVKDYLLQDIARIVLQQVNQICEKNVELFVQLTQVIIELQPKINNKMKFVSHLIFGKFVELFPHVSVRFVRAAHKLKAYTGPDMSSDCKLKGAYAKRKWLSIQHTSWFLKSAFHAHQHDHWMPFFSSSSKRDDLADCFLMCINGLCGIPRNVTKTKPVKIRKRKVTSSSRKN